MNVFSEEVEEDWVNNYNIYLARGSETLVMDNSEEFVHISGSSDNTITTMKIDSEGEIFWETDYIFSGSGNAKSSEITIDQYDNVYVSGFCDNWNLQTTEFIVIKYDQNGNEIWAANCENVGYLPNSIVLLDIDQQQNVYITTRFATGTGISDYITIKYDINGQVLWSLTFDGAYGGDDVPSDILVDGSGNVFVIGLSEMANEDYDLALIKYNSGGELQWEQRYNAHCEYHYLYPRIALDGSENICLISMQKIEQYNYDFAIIKYDQNGNTLWTRSCSGTSQNSWDKPEDLIIDDSSNIYILGSLQNENTFTDMVTLKYSSDGELIWDAIYSGEGWNDYAAAITLDINNDIYITGMMEYWFNIIKYSSDGQQLWQIYWEDPDQRYDAYLSDIVVNSSGDVYILGYNNYTGITLIKYVQPDFVGINNNIITEVTFSLQNYPNPFNPETTISFFTAVDAENAELVIYNIKGQKVKTLVNEVLPAGEHSVVWDGKNTNNKAVASGIYFYNLKVDDKIIATKKCLLLK
jgi:hypothetical protein